MSVKAIANIPVKRPGPNDLTNIKHQMIMSIPRSISKSLRSENRTNLKGVMLYAARNASGKPSKDANRVPKTAISNVSKIENRTVPCIHCSLSLISDKTNSKLVLSVSILSLLKISAKASGSEYSFSGLKKSNQKYFHPNSYLCTSTFLL